MGNDTNNLSQLIAELLYIDSTSHQGDSQHTTDNPTLKYQTLLNNKDFSSAVGIIETLLLEESDNLGHRLSWILCQLELEQVPVLALCSPLEEIAPLLQKKLKTSVLSHHLLLPFAAGVYLKTGIVLINQQKLRLAVPIFEYAFDFANRLSLTKAEKESVRKLLLDIMQDEIAKAENRRDNAAYIKSLENSLVKFKKITITGVEEKPSTAIREVPTPIKESKGSGNGKNFSAKSLLQDFDKNYDNAPTQSVKLTPGIKITSDSAAKKIGISCAAIGFLILLFIVEGRFLFERSDSEIAVPNFNIDLRAEVELPVLEPLKERHDPDAALGAIALRKVEDRLQQLGKSLEDSIKPSVDNHDANKPDMDRPPVETVQAVSKQPPQRPQRLQPDIQPKYDQYYGNYDTYDNPAERVGYNNQNRDYRRLMPRLDADTAASRKIDVIESGERRIDASELHRRPDGRVYGPPVGIVGVNKTVDAGAGKNVKGLYVEQFNPPVAYRTIVEVQVLSSPSAVSYPIADLPRGASIGVTATMGPWLEIVSEKGRKGYIYTQDAEKK